MHPVAGHRGLSSVAHPGPRGRTRGAPRVPSDGPDDAALDVHGPVVAFSDR